MSDTLTTRDTQFTYADTAQPRKLPDDSWGVGIEGDPRPGDDVVVTSKEGKSWTRTVAEVVSSAGGVCLCSLVPDERRG